jgi:hypothetical protein
LRERGGNPGNARKADNALQGAMSKVCGPTARPRAQAPPTLIAGHRQGGYGNSLCMSVPDGCTCMHTFSSSGGSRAVTDDADKGGRVASHAVVVVGRQVPRRRRRDDGFEVHPYMARIIGMRLWRWCKASECWLPGKLPQKLTRNQAVVGRRSYE